MKGISRRDFMKATAATGVVLGVGGFLKPRKALAAFYQSPNIPMFVDPLRGLDTIPVAAPDVNPAPVTGVTHYTINIQQFQDRIVPTSSGLGKTTLWGYQPTNPLIQSVPGPAHLGGIIVGQKGQPIQITFQNMLPTPHILPVDTTIPGAELAQNRAAVHLHGGLVPWISDGGPFDWFAPAGSMTPHGLSFLNNVLNPGALDGQAEYYYPLNQTARFMWYHDHAVGITRLNAYAGIASGMLIRDKFEGALRNFGLPDFIENGGNELPIVIQDKIFVGDDINMVDPDYQGLKTSGSLWYAHTYPDPVSGPAGSPPEPSAVPEFFGDTMLVNGASYPVATVQARRYRLRILNACNARFLNLQLYVANSSNGVAVDSNGNLVNPTPFINAATGKATWLQIGTEGGFLATPALVPSNVPLVAPPPDAGGSVDPSLVQKSLLVAPAERPDVIVDFKGYEGMSIVLYNDAPAPFPGGDPLTDYYPGLNTSDNPANNHADGVGPNTRVLMRFDVIPASGPADKRLFLKDWSPLFIGIDPFLLPPFIHQVPNFIKKRFLTLNEINDGYGRLIQILGNAAAPNGSPYFLPEIYANYPGQPEFPLTGQTPVSPTEEDVNEGDVEAWEIFNTTGDVHPMHFHLVNVQVVNRQKFSGPATNPTFTGPIIPADQNEIGWKETVQMYPGTVTRVIMKFDLPSIVDRYGRPVNSKFIKNGEPPTSPRLPGCHEYVWHCHILEHEEHDMMHALCVKPKKKW